MDTMVQQQSFKEYISSISELCERDNDIKYSLLLETNYIEMEHPDVIYPEYYIQKKRMLEELAFFYYGVINTGTTERKQKKRIAICTNTWRGKGYSIGIVVAALANEFVRQGYEVAVFIENQFIHDARIAEILKPELLVDAREYCREHVDMLLPEVGVRYNAGDTMRDRVVQQIESIFCYEPDCVFDLTDENSCCSRILYEKIPVLYYPMRGNHGTSMFFHKYLAVDVENMREVNRIYQSFDDELIEPVVGIITEFPHSHIQYRKPEELGDDKWFVIITVGNRLVHDLNKEFIYFVIDTLLKNPNFIWVFVGEEVPEFLMEKRDECSLQNRIIFRGYEKDLVAFYHICDVYVNPMRKGGGLSIAWAMHEGLPVAMLKFMSDGLSWIGEENAVAGGYGNLQDYIVALSKNYEFYTQMGNKMKERISQRTPSKCVEQLCDIIQKFSVDVLREMEEK